MARTKKPATNKASQRFLREKARVAAMTAELLTGYRKRSGLSVRAAAKKAGCAFMAVHKYETGKRSISDLGDICALLRVYGVALVKFVRDLEAGLETDSDADPASTEGAAPVEAAESADKPESAS